MEIELVVIGFERQEQIEDVFQRLLGLGVVAVDLVDDDDRLEAQLQRLGQHEFGLRHDALGRIDQEHHAIDHGQDALHLAAEIGVAGRVDDVDARAMPLDAGAFGQDGDAALALQIVGIHGALGHVLVFAHRAGLLEELVHKRGLPMVDMGDDGNVANIHGYNSGSGSAAYRRARSAPQSQGAARRRKPAKTAKIEAKRAYLVPENALSGRQTHLSRPSERHF